MTLCVTAPGKLMLAGEYVVLDGARALVTAVDRRASACWGSRTDASEPPRSRSAESGNLPPEALLARTLAERRLGSVPRDMTLNVSALRSGDRKLGLGSSAAGAAAAAGAVFAYAGRDIHRPEVRSEVLEVALEGHRSVAPQGSGADVAASVLGGFVRFRKEGEKVVEAEQARWPAGLSARIVWTGKEARTSTLVSKVRELEASDRTAYRDRMGELRQAAEKMVDAFSAGDAAATIEATHAHHQAMASLGQAAGAPIVEERLTCVAELAERAGGAAKPSGAGGGDVAIALFEDQEAVDSFEEWCRAEGMEIVPLGLGADGITSEEAHSVRGGP